MVNCKMPETVTHSLFSYFSPFIHLKSSTHSVNTFAAQHYTRSYSFQPKTSSNDIYQTNEKMLEQTIRHHTLTMLIQPR